MELINGILILRKTPGQLTLEEAIASLRTAENHSEVRPIVLERDPPEWGKRYVTGFVVGMNPQRINSFNEFDSFDDALAHIESMII